MASKKLSDAQTKAMKRLYHAPNHNLNSEWIPHNTGRSLAKLGYVTQLRDFSWSLLDSGLQLAESLFGTPDPTPVDDSEPVADSAPRYQVGERLDCWIVIDTHNHNAIKDECHNEKLANKYAAIRNGGTVSDDDPDSPVARFQVSSFVIDSDPLAFDDETEVVAYLRECEAEGENLRDYLVQEHTLARLFSMQKLVESINAETWLEEHSEPVAEIVDILNVQFTRRPDGTLEKLPATVDASKVAKVAAHDAYVDSVYGGKRAIEWHSLDELPMHRFQNALQRIGFVTWRDRQPLCDINGNAVSSPVNAPRRNLAAKKVSLPNMQSNRQYTGKMRKASHRKFRNVQGVQCETEGALVAFGETRRAMTPHTGQVRRVAETLSIHQIRRNAMKQIKRHGDVLFVKRESLPAGEQKPIARDNGRVVVAYGEVTGHAHATVAPDVQQVEIDTIRWLVAPAEFVITHEEHAPITLDSGVWEVVYQAEYTPQEIRRVLD